MPKSKGVQALDYGKGGGGREERKERKRRGSKSSRNPMYFLYAKNLGKLWF